MKSKTLTQLFILCAAPAFLTSTLVADEKSEATEKEEKAEAVESEEEEEEKADITVVIEGNDTMKFDKEAFTVEAGKKVKLVFKNVGNLPKLAMGHNVVILKKGINVVEFATAALAASATEYIPEAKKDDIFAHTKMLGPKEETSIIFTAPEPGKYDYICTFPGHFAVMKGVMTVK